MHDPHQSPPFYASSANPFSQGGSASHSTPSPAEYLPGQSYELQGGDDVEISYGDGTGDGEGRALKGRDPQICGYHISRRVFWIVASVTTLALVLAVITPC